MIISWLDVWAIRNICEFCLRFYITVYAFKFEQKRNKKKKTKQNYPHTFYSPLKKRRKKNDGTKQPNNIIRKLLLNNISEGSLVLLYFLFFSFQFLLRLGTQCTPLTVRHSVIKLLLLLSFRSFCSLSFSFDFYLFVFLFRSFFLFSFSHLLIKCSIYDGEYYPLKSAAYELHGS